MKKTAKSLVEEAMCQVTTYTVEQARALHGHPGVQFVDVRDVRELEHEGVIPGAIHAPRGLLEFWFDPESQYHRDVFAQDKEYVLFCAAGWRSAKSASPTSPPSTPTPVCILSGMTSAPRAKN